MQNINFYSLFEFSPVPMWVFDVTTLRFLDVNLAAVQNYGFSKMEFLTMTVDEIRPEEERALVRTLIKENNNNQSLFKQTFIHRRKNGELIHVEVESNLINYNHKDSRIVLAHDVTERIKVEQELQRSEQRFKALVQDGSDMITIIDGDFNYKYVSPASLRVFGVEPAFFIGRNAFQYIHRDDLERLNEEAKKIWEHKQIQLSPYRYKDIAGDWLWIETRATNLLDDPAVEGIVCTSKDITERINNERRILESIERFNIVSKATSDIIWDCDFKANKIIWNKAIKGILKHDGKEETTYDWWKENIHPEDRDRVVSGLEHNLNNRVEKWQDEYRFLCGDGQYKYIFDRGFVVLNGNEKPFRMIGAMEDISKRKEEEQWSKLLESVVINTSDGVLITDAAPAPGPYIIYVNDALIQLSGYSRAELIGSSPAIFHGKNVAQNGLNELFDAIEQGKECQLELINYAKNGKEYDVSITICPVFNEKGVLSSWISIHRDITKQRQYIEAIEAQNKRLKEIRWLQSHGVRAPLSRVMSLVELLKTSKTAAERKELMDYLSISADELDEVITAIANQTPKES